MEQRPKPEEIQQSRRTLWTTYLGIGVLAALLLFVLIRQYGSWSSPEEVSRSFIHSISINRPDKAAGYLSAKTQTSLVALRDELYKNVALKGPSAGLEIKKLLGVSPEELRVMDSKALFIAIMKNTPKVRVSAKELIGGKVIDCAQNGDQASVTLYIERTKRKATFTLIREGGKWLIDDYSQLDERFKPK